MADEKNKGGKRLRNGSVTVGKTTTVSGALGIRAV